MPLVTVSEVLRLALPPESTLLAGREGLGEPVTWARLLRSRPAALGAIEPGEVWLLSAAAMQQLGPPSSIARLIEDVADAGVAALIFNEPPPAEALAQAQASGTPTILIPRSTPLKGVEDTIVAFVVDRDRAVRERVHEVHEALLATLVGDGGSEEIARIVHAVTAKAVYLLDEHFQSAVQVGGDEKSAEGVAELRRRFWEGQLGNLGERLLTVRERESDTLNAIAIRPITLRGATQGYLALFGLAADFADFDHQLADRAASVLAIELAKQSAVVEARLRVQGDFLDDVLDGALPLSPDLILKARGLGYDLAARHLAFVLRPRAHSDGALSPRLTQRFVDVARKRMVLMNASVLVREQRSALQILLPLPPELVAADVGRVVDWVDSLRADVEAALAPDTLPLSAGVGRSSADVLHHTAMREALQAADIASTIPGDRATLHFARLGVLRLIFHLADHPELRAFQRDLLGPLEDYDRLHRADFVQTLEAFFRAGGNHMQAARDLHVHRNTLIYRLGRAQELLGGTDLEDPDTRLNLQLALKIRAALTSST